MLVLVPLPAAAELRLPAGFTVQVYVTGEGFDTDAWRGRNGATSAARSTTSGRSTGSPQVAATRRGRQLFVTTFDRERRIGALYRLADGRAELFATTSCPSAEPSGGASGIFPEASGNMPARRLSLRILSG